jgi:hypothetical protein
MPSTRSLSFQFKECIFDDKANQLSALLEEIGAGKAYQAHVNAVDKGSKVVVNFFEEGCHSRDCFSVVPFVIQFRYFTFRLKSKIRVSLFYFRTLTIWSIIKLY